MRPQSLVSDTYWWIRTICRGSGRVRHLSVHVQLVQRGGLWPDFHSVSVEQNPTIVQTSIVLKTSEHTLGPV